MNANGADDVVRASLRLREAAESMNLAADRIESATHRLALLLEDGYGGNGLLLLEALNKAEATWLKLKEAAK